ncbi:PilW family protein [Veronia pacifica]|uniref:Pilus assembly protein PilW n=1 Tax=Veronia pacifica TaxID=1080227 RepID=A0A1C3E735_9GAMM|nr:prepilin-type N-terminal cleavage/methylation domain-containing protein [Veronia pacifica]ODA29065.1 hypothetical protein A8L45_22720 [Veronia pacifica]
MKKQAGFSLVELMVGSAVSLIVIATSVAALTSSMSIGNEQLQRDYLTSQLNVIANMMSQEISRAGYCFDCGDDNPYIIHIEDSGASTIVIDDLASNSTGDCIRFAYNHDSRAGVETRGLDDLKGFRLDANNGLIEIYENYDGVNNWQCNGRNWMDINYNRLKITALSFNRKALSTSGEDSTVQQIEVTLTAEVREMPDISETLKFNVTVWNVDS